MVGQLAATAALLAWVALALPVGAQGQGVAESGMGQGQASIGVRSDVTLAIEGARSTPQVRLQQITDVVTDRLSELRKCYRQLAAKRPTAAGSLAVRIILETGAAPAALEIKTEAGTDPDVTGCVKRSLEPAAFRKVERPAAAVLSLEFTNSRAKGEQVMAERRQVAEQVEIHAKPGGEAAGYEARWSTPDGKVAFLVSRSEREGIDTALRKLRDSFAAFADCRRRSEQGGRSPAGSLTLQLQLQSRGKARSKLVTSSVAHPRAAPCVERALGGITFGALGGSQPLEMQITFGE
jgi:hypothetical protein